MMNRTLFRLLTIPAAVIAALLTWAVFVPLLGIELAASTGAEAMPIGPIAVAAAAAVPALLAWLVLALLERFTRNPRRIFVIAAAVVLAASVLLGPLGGVTPGAVVGLIALHAVVAVTITAMLVAAPQRIPEAVPA